MIKRRTICAESVEIAAFPEVAGRLVEFDAPTLSQAGTGLFAGSDVVFREGAVSLLGSNPLHLIA